MDTLDWLCMKTLLAVKILASYLLVSSIHLKSLRRRWVDPRSHPWLSSSNELWEELIKNRQAMIWQLATFSSLFEGCESRSLFKSLVFSSSPLEVYTIRRCCCYLATQTVISLVEALLRTSHLWSVIAFLCGGRGGVCWGCIVDTRVRCLQTVRGHRNNHQWLVFETDRRSSPDSTEHRYYDLLWVL